MNYVDFAIASSIFIIFFAVALMLSTNYFSNLSSLTKTSEFRSTSENFFKIFFESKGVPENWDDYSNTPVKIGLAEDLYMTSVLVKETNGSSRTNEPVMAQIVFDESCQNKSWNNSIRMYDEDWNQINLEISNTTFCTNQFLNQSNITWEVNISANQNKKYYLYYSPNDGITNPSYTSLSYITSSWIPNDRDSWTETTANWTIFLGSGTVTNDTENKIRGNSSVNITGTFDVNNDFGLDYLSFSSSDDITGVNNDWYIDVWIYVDNKTGLNHLYVQLWCPDSYEVSDDIYNNITDSTWYHFVKPLDYRQWSGGSGFPNFSNGIDFVRFYMTNTTSGLFRTLKIDGLHFKKKPLDVKTFPEEKTIAVSANKFDALKNISYDEARKTAGENYKFRLEVGNETYGGNINMSANIGCSEYPKIVENKNGKVSKTIAKMCVWK